MDRVRRDSQSRRLAIEEVLRWEPPVALMPRFAPVDTDQFGPRIPAGSHVLFGIAGANRDPAVFPDPERFDMDRVNKGTLTFGFGTHFCVGAHLARAELSAALDVVLERLDDLRLVGTNPTRMVGSILRGPDTLPVTFTARQP
jgi:cytochrome P450